MYEADKFFHVVKHFDGYAFTNRNGTSRAVVVSQGEDGMWRTFVRGQWRFMNDTLEYALQYTAEKILPGIEPCLEGKGSRMDGALTRDFFKGE